MAQAGVNDILSPLPQRAFGRSGRSVSVLGLGTVKFGRNKGVKYPGGDGFALPSDADIANLLDLSIDLGINLIDTAPAYGTAEERLGALLGARRDKFFIVSKTGEEFDAEAGTSEYIFTAAHTRHSVERSLQRLKTDFIDCLLVHSNRDDVDVINNTPVLETLAQLKAEGKIGQFGISTYTIEGGTQAAALCDAVMVAHNRDYTAEAAVIAHAKAQGCAVLVKKGLASGHMADAATLAENIGFVLQTPGVTSLVFGSLNPENIRANARAALAAV
jgi:aryl-alcohol dehydrogenase-like predicted oxidoreductase